MSNSYSGVPELATALEVAEKIGVHKSTVNRIARDHQLGKPMGNQRVYTASDIAKIKRFCKFSKGNPNFGKKL